MMIQQHPYAPLPEHTLEQSPCYPIIAVRHGYFYRRLHREIKNVYLESWSIKSGIKIQGRKSELLNFPKITHD